MNYNLFFKNYLSYISYPILFFLSLICQLENQYYKEFKKTIKFLNTEDSEFDFIMLDEYTNIDTIQDNKCVFINKYEEEINNIKYICVLTFREQILLNKYYYEIMHMFNKNKLQDKYPEIYTIYKVNKTTCDILIYASKINLKEQIKEFLYNNFIHIKNILKYKKKYNFDDLKIEDFYYEWTKPIEPSNKNEYLELIKNYISKTDTKFNEINYTDIKCIRNTIQKDYLNYINEIYGDTDVYDNFDLKHIPMIYTTYRIENKTGIIYTILY